MNSSEVPPSELVARTFDALNNKVAELQAENERIRASSSQRIATLEIEKEDLIKARERADEDALMELKDANRRVSNFRELMQRHESDLEVCRATLRQSEQSRMSVSAQNAKLIELMGDAQRSLELGDRLAAVGCLREASGVAEMPVPSGPKAEEPVLTLKPCPCCGGPAERYKDGDGPTWGWAARCTGCGLKTIGLMSDKQAGLRRWNTRSAT